MREDIPVIYTHSVDWKLYDAGGNFVDSGSKVFESLKRAEAYARKLKRDTPSEDNLLINIRELGINQVVRSYKKKSGNINSRRVR